MNDRSPLPDIQAALRLFDETTSALEARARRLEEVLTVKQAELLQANAELEEKVDQLARLRAYTDLVLASVPAGVVAVDRDGIITTCNPVAVRVLARDGCAIEGVDYRTVLGEGPLLAVLRSGVARGGYEHRLDGADGPRRVLAAHAAPIRKGEEIIGAVETFEDVTELRRLEDQLERNERLKALGEMAAGVAHEIRNPLNGIEGFASLLKRDLPQTGRNHHYIDAIIGGVRHLNHTVTGLLEFTRPRPPRLRACPPGELARSCVELVMAEAAAGEGPAAQVECESQWDDARRVAVDPGQIRQVLLNLIQNAAQVSAQHRGAGGRVRVRVEPGEGAMLVFRVDDDGPGVDPAERHRIFTPFYTTRDEGTGLGLAVAHTIVALHGGELSVDDGELGGACFTVRLPGDANASPQ